MHSMACALGWSEHAEPRAIGFCNHQNKFKFHQNTFKSTFQSLPDVQIQFRDKFSLSTFQGEFKFHSFKAMKSFLFVCFSRFSLLFWNWLSKLFKFNIYITPSNQHFKAFQMSKFNSETSFLYQLFKGNSNFTVWKPWKVLICLFFMIFIVIYIYSQICLFMHSYTFISTF